MPTPPPTSTITELAGKNDQSKAEESDGKHDNKDKKA